MPSLSSMLKEAMAEDPIDKAIYAYYKKRFEKEQRHYVIGDVHPSFYNGCGRKLQLSWMPGAKPKFPGIVVQDIFDNGTYTHRRIQRVLKRAGVLSAVEVPMEDKKRGIIGTMDGRLAIPRKGIIEIKSINSFGFQKLKAPMSYHSAQGTLYFHLSGEEYLLFLYENKDNQTKKRYEVHRNEKLVKHALHVISDAQEAFHEEKLLPLPPEATGPSSEMCRMCPFKDYCHTSYGAKTLNFPRTRLVGKRVVLADTKRKSLLRLPE